MTAARTGGAARAPEPVEREPLDPEPEAIDGAPSPHEGAGVDRADLDRGGADLEAIASASPTHVAPGALAVARVRRCDAVAIEVEIGGVARAATLDPSVHRAVVEGACRRGELLLVTVDASGTPTVVGALRTQPTPGIDAVDTLRLEADRVEIVGRQEVQIRSGAAALAVRAVGEIESYADRIVSRAEEVQKIIGRLLRLN